MTTDMEFRLIRRAVQLFPMMDYTKPSAVRHARRVWVAVHKQLVKQANWALRETRLARGAK